MGTISILRDAGMYAINTHTRASLVAQTVENPPAVKETWSHPWVGKIA